MIHGHRITITSLSVQDLRGLLGAFMFSGPQLGFEIRWLRVCPETHVLDLSRLDAEAVAFVLQHGEAKVVITDKELSGTVGGGAVRLSGTRASRALFPMLGVVWATDRM